MSAICCNPAQKQKPDAGMSVESITGNLISTMLHLFILPIRVFLRSLRSPGTPESTCPNSRHCNQFVRLPAPLQAKCRERGGDRAIKRRARNIADDFGEPGPVDGMRRRPQIGDIGELAENWHDDAHHVQQSPRNEVNLEVPPA